MKKQNGTSRYLFVLLLKFSTGPFLQFPPSLLLFPALFFRRPSVGKIESELSFWRRKEGEGGVSPCEPLRNRIIREKRRGGPTNFLRVRRERVKGGVSWEIKAFRPGPEWEGGKAKGKK